MCVPILYHVYIHASAAMISEGPLCLGARKLRFRRDVY